MDTFLDTVYKINIFRKPFKGGDIQGFLQLVLVSEI